MTREIKFKFKALEGERVMVKNYRKPSAEFELGTVTRVELTVYKDGRCFDSYTVVLDRKSAIRKHFGFDKGGRRLALYVSGDDLYLA